MTIEQIIRRYAREAGKPDADLLMAQSGNVHVDTSDHRNLLSYGRHFVLARIMLDQHGKRSWWLVNGDTYSPSTSHHQSVTRSVLRASGLPLLILPFTTLNRAGINRETIQPADIRPDRTEYIAHSAATLADVPGIHRWAAARNHDKTLSHVNTYHGDVPDDGRWHWETSRHWLGDSLFTADYRSGSASFLSSFDYQENPPQYFLCQLPANDSPHTVSEAIEALKPAAVREAEADGLTVTRQGDVFAIPSAVSTRDLHRQGATRTRAYVLNVNHTASEVVETPGGTYARGTLRHAPREWGRRPEHAMRRIGDGKTWHLLVKNTVPDTRSWSAEGNVD